MALVDVPGLGISDAQPLTHNVTDVAVVFAGGATFAPLLGKRVRLALEIADGFVYTVGFAESAAPAPSPRMSGAMSLLVR